ncbi:thermonuclease family protein [Thioalkalivibrio sp. ALE16]|uniref:thermonuclease family protein n=1 Tax=Thioalkalivibrio sp. ALE16 TaxID=1158172 RepID=UPI0005B47E52|nr:thermonuclease family protein [Thioalkalivibrio sp. ALE16]
MRLSSVFSVLLAAPLLVFSAPVFSGSFEVFGSGEIYWVADGDTMIVTGLTEANYATIKRQAEEAQSNTGRDLRVEDRFNDRHRSMLVRIGNIDTPESVHPDPSRNTAEGQAASDYVKDLMADARVDYVCWDIGHWGRPICSLYGGDFGAGWDLGVHLVDQGYADYIDDFGPHPYWPEIYEQVSRP